MATLEDKILGNKMQNYCSSSEDEGGSDDDEDYEDCETSKNASDSGENSLPQPNKWTGSSSNTGPKGVIEDWRRFKQLETEHRAEQDRERVELIKKLSITCRTEREDDEAKETKELEDELDELVDDDFFLQYQKQRIQELMAKLNSVPQFGKVLTLNTKDAFLSAVDKESSSVTVVIHIYNDNIKACEAMDGCMNILAKEYSTVKFCRIAVGVTGLSRNFRIDGLPALLVYKGGHIIGNFVKISSELGNDFYANDVEHYLTEFGLLPEKQTM